MPHPHPKEPTGCRYIHGEVPGLDWHYCQEPRLDESAYCATHHAACHIPADKADAHLRALVSALSRMAA